MELKSVIFTKHAVDKFRVLEKHKVIITERQVIDTLFKPLSVEPKPDKTFIASSNFSKRHVLRVVYKKIKDSFKIITFYPAKKKQYGF